MTPARFPDSEIPGSKLACSSPRHFAAGRVLHRLSLPRHPPRALSSLTPSRQQIWLGQESIRRRHLVFTTMRFSMFRLPETATQRGTSPLCGWLLPKLLTCYLHSAVDENRLSTSDSMPLSASRYYTIPASPVKRAWWALSLAAISPARRTHWRLPCAGPHRTPKNHSSHLPLAAAGLPSPSA